MRIQVQLRGLRPWRAGPPGGADDSAVCLRLLSPPSNARRASNLGNDLGLSQVLGRADRTAATSESWTRGGWIVEA